jgi:hypothetical protein
MKHTSLAVLIVLLLFVPGVAQAQANVRCESNGGRRECTFNGIGTVKIANQISSSSCIEGQSWGYSGNMIWVDKGCRADFLVSSTGKDMPSGMPLQCESSNNHRHTCVADTQYGVQLSRQLSQKACVFGKTWGYTNSGVWVDRGCRAEFLVLNTPPSMASGSNPSDFHGTVNCESLHGGRKFCSADTRFGVQVGRQLSDRDCEFNRTWGFDSRGIWVDKGCKADFILGHQ